jgi:hypothetical protein
MLLVLRMKPRISLPTVLTRVSTILCCAVDVDVRGWVGDFAVNCIGRECKK